MPRPRSGRQIPVSMRNPATAAAAIPNRRGDQDVQPDALVHPPRDDRPERDELTVGEVRQPRRAVDQRQADGGDGDDQAELDPVGDRLGQLIPPALGLAAARTEVVVEDLASRSAERSRPVRRRPRRSTRHRPATSRCRGARCSRPGPGAGSRRRLRRRWWRSPTSLPLESTTVIETPSTPARTVSPFSSVGVAHEPAHRLRTLLLRRRQTRRSEKDERGRGETPEQPADQPSSPSTEGVATVDARDPRDPILPVPSCAARRYKTWSRALQRFAVRPPRPGWRAPAGPSSPTARVAPATWMPTSSGGTSLKYWV